MARIASPRLARLNHCRINERGITLIARIVGQAPRSEIGKDVHIPVGGLFSAEALPILRLVVAALEERESKTNGDSDRIT